MRILGFLRIAFGATRSDRMCRLVNAVFQLLSIIAELTETDLDDRVIEYLRAMDVDDRTIDQVLDAGGAEI